MMTNNMVEVSQREVKVEGVFKQFPLHGYGIDGEQNKEKLTFLNGTLDLKNGSLG